LAEPQIHTCSRIEGCGFRVSIRAEASNPKP
jgi:hypothetical protein